MKHSSWSALEEPDGWPGVFQPFLHYVPSGTRRLVLGGDLVVFAVCDAVCTYPKEWTAGWSWCLKCRQFLDTVARLATGI